MPVDPDKVRWYEKKMGLPPGSLDPERRKPIMPDDPRYEEIRARNMEEALKRWEERRKNR